MHGMEVSSFTVTARISQDQLSLCRSATFLYVKCFLLQQFIIDAVFVAFARR